MNQSRNDFNQPPHRWRAVALSCLLTAVSITCLAVLLFNRGQWLATWAASPSDQIAYQTPGGFTISAPVAPVDGSTLPPAEVQQPNGQTLPDLNPLPLPKSEGRDGLSVTDTALQTVPGQADTPSYLASFEGLHDISGIQPPDTNGAVGPNDYIQMVNNFPGGSNIGIYNKTSGALKYPEFSMNNMFPLGNPCREKGGGDPVVVYDQLADRWILSQFVNPGPPYYECFAVSKTGTPTNLPADWWLYPIQLSNTLLNDYPKIGVWPDGYYMMAHQFAGTSWAGTGVWVFERDKMLNGQPAIFQYKNLFTVDSNYGGMLPSTLVGEVLPPPGAPNYYIEVDKNWANSGSDIMHVFAFHTDWVNPSNTNFSVANQLVVAPFTSNLCSSSRQVCIDQPGQPKSVEALNDRLMMHAAYRNTGDHEVIVFNHTVNADGLGKAGIRWYEIRKSQPAASFWSIYQQGTYAPDGSHRWVGSISIDHMGNIALGYSVSSLSVSPAVRYAGRQPGDALGTLGSEQSLVEGGSSFYGTRWGDYSSMTMDPVDDCTFWYTQEYVPSGTVTWHTRIGAFKFPTCTKGPMGALAGQLTDQKTGGSLANTPIFARRSLTITFPTLSDASGHYALPLNVGSYTISSAPYGYQPYSKAGVIIASNQTTQLNIAFAPAPTTTISGKITDATKGWPLYAHISVSGSPTSPTPPYNSAWSDPQTGQYQLVLVKGGIYTLTVQAFSPGYLPMSYTSPVLNSPQVHNVTLLPDLVACSAPGYNRNGFLETFDSVTPPNLPDGWQVTTVTGTTGAWHTNQGTNNPSGFAAHSPLNLVYFNSFDAAAGASVRLYRTSPVDMTKIVDKNLTFWVFHDQDVSANLDSVQVQVSTDGGVNWQNVGSPILPSSGLDWIQHSVSLSGFSGATNLLVGFLGYSDFGYDVHLDDLALDPQCSVESGGLVVGTVTNGDTGSSLTNTTIHTDSGRVYSTKATGDPAVGSAFYTAFSPAGSHIFTATHTGFEVKTMTVPVLLNSTVRQDFTLHAGKLKYTPNGISVSLPWGSIATSPLTITNIGLGPAVFEITATVGGFNPLFPVGHTPYKPKVSSWPAAEHPFELAPIGGAKNPPQQGPNAWASGALIPTGPRVRAAAASCDGTTLYLFGGQTVFGVVNEAFRYNPADNSWTTLAAMPVALTNLQAACIGNFIYLVGGYTGSSHTNEFQVYDTIHNTWAHSSWPNIRTPMLTAYNKKLYAIGGSPGPNSETWMYNPLTNAWQNMNAAMPVAAEYGAALTVGDYIYIVGGAASSELAAVQRYDPNNNTWASGPPLPQARLSPIAAWYGTKLYVAGGGRLVSGAFTAYDSTYSYDYSAFPGGNWVLEPDTLSQPVVGAGSVCASNRIYALGGNNNRTNYGTNQYLDSGLKCHYGVNNVPWLSVLPTTGAFSSNKPGSTRRLALTFNASVSTITQPGSYFANLMINNDTPAGQGSVPVTMTVQAPAAWGKVTGVVRSLGYCDTSPVLLNQADVLIKDHSGMTATLKTNAQGGYTYWLDAGRKPITLTVSYAGQVTQQAGGISLTAGQTSTQNFDLRLAAPCAKASPAQINLQVAQGKTASRQINLQNLGASSYTWNLYEISGLASAADIRSPAGTYDPLARQAPVQSGKTWPVFVPNAPDQAIFSQGFESGLMPPAGWTRQVVNSSNTWVITNTASMVYTGTRAAAIHWNFNQNEWLVSPPIQITEGILSFWSMGDPFWCRDNHDNCDLNVWIVIGAPGGGDDIFVGKADSAWAGTWIWSQSVFDLTTKLPNGPIRIGFQYLGSDGNDVALDEIRLDGLTNSNVPWLSESPTFGSLAGGAAQTVNITISALPTMTVSSTYMATLQLRTSDLNNFNIKIPVAVTVVSNFKLFSPLINKGP